MEEESIESASNPESQNAENTDQVDSPLSDVDSASSAEDQDVAGEKPVDFIRPPRYQADINLVVEKDGDYEYARMQDFSVRGFMCVLYSKYSKNMRLHFALEGPKTEFRCLGELVWVKRKTWFPRQTWLAGVRIVGNKLPTEFMTEIAGVRVNDDETMDPDSSGPGQSLTGKGERRSGGDRRFGFDRRFGLDRRTR